MFYIVLKAGECASASCSGESPIIGSTPHQVKQHQVVSSTSAVVSPTSADKVEVYIELDKESGNIQDYRVISPPSRTKVHSCNTCSPLDEI